MFSSNGLYSRFKLEKPSVWKTACCSVQLLWFMLLTMSCDHQVITGQWSIITSLATALNVQLSTLELELLCWSYRVSSWSKVAALQTEGSAVKTAPFFLCVPALWVEQADTKLPASSSTACLLCARCKEVWMCACKAKKMQHAGKREIKRDRLTVLLPANNINL